MQPAVEALTWRATLLALACVTMLARSEPGVTAARAVVPLTLVPFALLVAVRRIPQCRAIALTFAARLARNNLPIEVRESLARAEVMADRGSLHGESPELAALHLERLDARVDWSAFDAGVAQAHRRLLVTARVVVAAMVAVVVFQFHAVAEGVAVLTARGSEARFSLASLRGAQVIVRAPAYLRVVDATAPFEGTVIIHAGSDVEARARVVRPAVAFVAVCGDAVLPLTSDGQGSVLARRSVRESETWRLGRRVAGVFIPDGAVVVFETARDALPVVELKGAPKQLLLSETDRDGGVAIAYRAEDDHGLREVQLVLRSGTLEERRPLATLDGAHLSDSGASFVRTSAPFFRRAIGPVELRVEARDDGREGARWGRSEAIVVVPPALGTAEAERFKSLVMLRDHEVDRLAHRLVPAAATSVDPLAEWLVDLEDEREEIDASLGTSTLGLLVPPSVRSSVRRSVSKLQSLAENLPRRDSESGRKDVLSATEEVVLDLDGALRQLAWTDAKVVARRIGQQVQNASDSFRPTAPATLGDDLAHLDAAGRTLRVLGPLGRDLGDLIEGELARVKPLVAPEPGSAKFLLAALARRLARPDPSFGARGSGKGGTGDGRAGMGGEGSSEGTGSEGSDAEANAGGAGSTKGSAVDELAGEQQMLRRAGEGLTHEPLGGEREEREEHAKRLQSLGAADELRHGEGETQLRKAADLVRRGDFARARQAVNDAEHTLPKGSSRERAALRGRIQDEGTWLDEKLHGDAKVLAEDEKRLADRARQLRPTSRDEAVSKALDKSAEAMDRASQAFREGKIREGVDAQGVALDSLDAARDALQSEDAKGSDEAAHAAVPRTEEARAAAWRRRVIEGLAGRRDTKVPEAVQRYEEGLLR